MGKSPELLQRTAPATRTGTHYDIPIRMRRNIKIGRIKPEVNGNAAAPLQLP
jgi:hypothetical protein